MQQNTLQEMELCLCSFCAHTFYDMAEYRIVRKDPYQTEKEPCTYCSIRLGYDFVITRKSSVRNDENVRIRMNAWRSQNG